MLFLSYCMGRTDCTPVAGRNEYISQRSDLTDPSFSPQRRPVFTAALCVLIINRVTAVWIPMQVAGSGF